MSLQALRQIPSVNHAEKLRQTLAANRWAIENLYLDPSYSITASKYAWIKKAREAFFTAQDELNRILGRRNLANRERLD